MELPWYHFLGVFDDRSVRRPGPLLHRAPSLMNILDLNDDALESLLSRLDVVTAARAERVAHKLHDMQPLYKLRIDRDRFRQCVKLVARLKSACHKELGSQDTCKEVLNEMADISAQENYRRELAHAGIMAALVRAFQRWPIKSASTYNAAAVLWNVTARNLAMPAVDMVAQLVDAGGVATVVKLMTCKLPPSGMRAAKFAMVALSNAMSKEVECAVCKRVEHAVRVAGLKCDLYSKLVALLDTWADETDAHAQLNGIMPVMGVLWGLANRGESALHLGSQPGCFHSLLRLMSSDDVELRYQAAGVLCNLVDFRENFDRFEAVGGLDVLKRLKDDNSVPPSGTGDEEMEVPEDDRSIAYLAGIALHAVDYWMENTKADSE